MAGLFERLFGGAKKAANSRPSSATEHEARTEEYLAAGGEQRPSDIVFAALEAWNQAQPDRTENLFKQGIDAYRRLEPDGVDFALGRYAAFLIDYERRDEALQVLEQATGRGTDISAIWADYLQLLADRRNIDDFRRGVERMAASRLPVEPEFLLAFARRADREDATDFAEALARLVMQRAEAERDSAGRWAAAGDLGRILEHADRVTEAMTLWRHAFDEGSNDAETINRLSMQLEKAKDYAAAIGVIREGLKRQLPANVEETLRKRLVRCEAKGTGKRQGNTSKASAEVDAFSIRHGDEAFETVFQVRLKPAIKDLEIHVNYARCLLSSKDATTIVDIDLNSGRELQRCEPVHSMKDLWFTTEGNGIGVHRTAAIGKGPSLLRFVAADGSVVAESAIPDATSDIAWGGGLWYVGCRDGFLYAFDQTGTQRWRWQTPGSERYDGMETFRPCPYLVSASETFAAVSSMDNIYAVSPSGKALWHASLPSEQQSQSITEGGITVTIEMHGMGPTVSFINATASAVIAGSSQGRVYEFDERGRVRSEHIVGEGQVKGALRPDGSVGAVWARSAVMFLDDRRVVDVPDAIEWPAGMVMLDRELALWRGKDLQLLDRTGALVWSIEFSKTITRVMPYGQMLVCAAGPLVAFRRCKPSS